MHIFTKAVVQASIVALFSILFLSLTGLAQTAPPASQLLSNPKIREAVQSGKLSPEEIENLIQALESGKISREEVEKLQKKAKLGTLTPDEIDMGKHLLEEKEKQKVPLDAKEVMPEAKPEAPMKTDDAFFQKTEKKDKDSLEVYGHKLFSGGPSTFAPIKALPVSNDYIVGPGDEVKVLMWGRLDESHDLEVDNEGVINFPKIGPLNVAGLSFGELKNLIRQKAEAITGVNVNVSMGRLRTVQVFVLGEVKNPGVYTVSSLASVTNALLTSGGPTRLGSLRNVQLKRRGKLITTIDLYDFLFKGDTSTDARLMPGDVIFVPQTGPMISISGNVKRAAVYELKDKITLQNAIALAGGLAADAFNQRIQIERTFKNQYQIVLDISFVDLQEEKPVPLQDGDLVQIFSTLPDPQNAVFLHGNVLRPGQYAYKPGIRLRDILPTMDSLDKDTHYPYALIKRYRLEDMKTVLIPFDLGKLVLSKDNTQNLPLKPLDEIYIFSKSMFEDKAVAVAKGEIRKPGRYPIDEMSVKDFILKAGGLTDNAHLQKGEIIRTDKDRSRHTIYFNVTAAMAGKPAHNLRLQHEDTIIIHSVWEEQWRKQAKIEGEIKNPGDYFLTKGMRIKDLIFKAGRFTRDAYLNEGHIYRTNAETKDMTLLTFNVEKAMAGDPAQNILLSDLDKVVIHSIWEFKERYTVSIKGLVNEPGDFPFAENMTARDLILVAGNVKDAAYLEEAELVRFDIVDGKAVETTIFKFNIKLAKENHPAHNFKLQPLDVITVKEIPEWWAKKKTVTIMGEVLFPGTYQIREEERISDVVARAGGYTDRGYLRGAAFTRETVRVIQQKRIDEMSHLLELEVARYTSEETQAALSKEDLASQKQFVAAQKVLLEKLKGTRASGRVVVELLPMGVMKGTRSDIILEDGDSLFIPKKSNTINVLGAVYNPNALIFDTKRPELKYYLAMTGGPTNNALAKELYIIRADGTVVSKRGGTKLGVSWNREEKRWGFWNKFEDTHLHPGDTVLVPERIKQPSFIKDAKDIMQILYQIAVTAGITITQVF